MDYARSPSPSTAGRSVDIELSGQEVITIDLDNLDPNPEDVLDLLKEGQCKVWVWTKLAGEYWRRGYLGAAEKIAQQAIDCEFSFRVCFDLLVVAAYGVLYIGKSIHSEQCDCVVTSDIRIVGQYSDCACTESTQASAAKCS